MFAPERAVVQVLKSIQYLNGIPVYPEWAENINQEKPYIVYSTITNRHNLGFSSSYFSHDIQVLLFSSDFAFLKTCEPQIIETFNNFSSSDEGFIACQVVESDIRFDPNLKLYALSITIRFFYQ